MHQLRTFIFANWSAKLLSIVAAVVVWLGVTSAEQRADVLPGSIPVRIVNVPPGLAAVADEREVKVTLIAERALWQRLSPDDLIAEVSASGLAEGVTELPVRITSRLPGVEVTRVVPPQILVRVESIIEKAVPVSIRITGQAAEGFSSGIPITNPERVVVRGPASQLGQIAEVVGSVTLSDDRRDHVADVTVAALIAGETPAAVTVVPGTVQATIPIARAGNVKTVGVLVATNGDLPANLALTSIQLTPSVVSLTGSATRLAEVQSISTEPIQLNTIEESAEIETSLVIPTGVQLVDATSTAVTVRVTVSPIVPPSTVDNPTVSP